MSGNLYEYYTGPADGAVAHYGTLQYACQTFTPTLGHTISSVKVLLYRDGVVSPGNLTVSIRAVDSGTGKPTGNDLCSGTTNGNTLPTGWTTAEWREITFATPVALSANIQYAICVIGLTSNGSNQWGICKDGSSPTYSGGQRGISADGGTTWTMVSGNDYVFYEYGLPTFTPPTSDSYTTKRLVVCASNEVWYENPAGTMIQLTASIGQLDTSDFISMFELYGKAFIVNRSKKKVVDFINVKLHTLDIIPSDPTGKTYPRNGTVITGSVSGASMVVDYVTALDGDTYIYGKRTTTATFLTTDICKGTVATTNDVWFTLDANEVGNTIPHFYDWTVYGNSSVFGTMPTNVTLGCNYTGRAVISGDPLAPHQWYMSRQGNPWDWLYGLNDAQSAVAGGNSDAGEVGDIIRALIPYKDDYLNFGCENSMWYLIGNPCDSGSISELDLTTGIYGFQSWCFDNEGNFYFFGTNGFYKCRIPGTPTCISQFRLPNLVNDETVNSSTYRIILNYDNKNVGIIINITKLSNGTNSNYWYDLRARDDSGISGFFPEIYPLTCGIYSAFYYESKDPTYRKLLLGCQDGYIRFFDPASPDDVETSVNTAIDSFVDFGPIQMNTDPNFTGKLTGLNIVSAGGGISGHQSDSDDVYYRIFSADSAEALIEKLYANTVPNITGEFKIPGKQSGTLRKKLNGSYLGIKIGNNTLAETWAFEQLLYDLKPSGKLK